MKTRKQFEEMLLGEREIDKLELLSRRDELVKAEHEVEMEILQAKKRLERIKAEHERIIAQIAA